MAAPMIQRWRPVVCRCSVYEAVDDSLPVFQRVYSDVLPADMPAVMAARRAERPGATLETALVPPISVCDIHAGMGQTFGPTRRAMLRDESWRLSSARERIMAHPGLPAEMDHGDIAWRFDVVGAERRLTVTIPANVPGPQANLIPVSVPPAARTTMQSDLDTMHGAGRVVIE